MNVYEESNDHPTDKTREELLRAREDELNSYERMLRSMMLRYPELTLEEAIEFLNNLP